MMVNKTKGAVGPASFEILRDHIDFVIAGERIEWDMEKEQTIGVDIDVEMDRMSARISYWGGVLAASRAEAEQLDGMYRQFRGAQTIAILAKDAKLAEWKVKARIDSSNGFMRHKNAKALSIRNTSQLETIVQALFTKSELLRSRGARKRREIDSQGMTTPSTKDRTTRSETTESDRAARVKRIRKKLEKKSKAQK